MPASTPGLENAYKSMLLPFAEEIPIYRLTGEPRSAVFDPLNTIFTQSHNSSALNPVLVHTLFQQFLCALSQQQDKNSYVLEEAGSANAQKYIPSPPTFTAITAASCLWIQSPGSFSSARITCRTSSGSSPAPL